MIKRYHSYIQIDRKERRTDKHSKNDTSKLKSTDKEQQQVLCDLTVEYSKMEQDIEALNKRCKKNGRK